MPDELLSYIQTVKTERQQQSVDNFARTAITKLEAALALEPLEKGIHTWADWRGARSDFPLYMDSCQKPLLISKLCKKPSAAPVWKAFMDFLDEHPHKGACGLVVKALGNGLYVVHNKWDLPQAAGTVRIRIAATTEGRGVCLEPLPALAAAIKLVWGP